MGVEREHKYLVNDESYKNSAESCVRIAQGYISNNPDGTVRLRIADDRAWITIKSRNHGDTRNEWEYPIPVTEARQMLTLLCRKPIIEKNRYIVWYAGHRWEVDEFIGDLSGLTVAEIELPCRCNTEDTTTLNNDVTYELPSWVGRNVTGDPRYYNSNLSNTIPKE